MTVQHNNVNEFISGQSAKNVGDERAVGLFADSKCAGEGFHISGHAVIKCRRDHGIQPDS